MLSTERQIMIQKAAQVLAKRLMSPCLDCQRVDFAVKTTENGSLCQLSGLPANEIQFNIKRCDCWGHQEKLKTQNANTDPGRCGFCNPCFLNLALKPSVHCVYNKIPYNMNDRSNMMKLTNAYHENDNMQEAKLYSKLVFTQ